MTAVRQRPASGAADRPVPPAESRAQTILVLSDDLLAAARIEAALRGDARWQVAVDRATDMARSVSRYTPAVVLLVLSPPRAEQALAALEMRPSPSPIILLTSNAAGAWASKVLRRSLRGILARDATAKEIVAAIGAARAGLLVLHPDATKASRSAPRSGATQQDAALTPREIEILEMMAEGLGNRSIAARLGISRHTVKFHVASVLGKLHAASRTEAVTVGIREGHIAI